MRGCTCVTLNWPMKYSIPWTSYSVQCSRVLPPLALFFDGRHLRMTRSVLPSIPGHPFLNPVPEPSSCIQFPSVAKPGLGLPQHHWWRWHVCHWGVGVHECLSFAPFLFSFFEKGVRGEGIIESVCHSSGVGPALTLDTYILKTTSTFRDWKSVGWNYIR